MTQNSFRKHLSMPGMLSEVRECFDSIPDSVVSRGITQSGCLMTGLGVFSLKMTSLLSFEEKIRSDESREPAENFMSLFGVNQVPSDSRLRERLDDVDPRSLRPTFKNIFSNCPATNLSGSGLCHPIDRDYGHRNIHRPY